MKQYTKLPIPKDSAWDRPTYLHWRIRRTVERIVNVVRWLPTIWNDHDWDDYYITKMLQKKIEFQREYLVKHNRHMEIDRDNRYMTLVLNLIEREHEEYYGMEYMDYIDEKMLWEGGTRSIEFETISDNSEAFLAKYKGAVRRMKKENFFDINNHEPSNKRTAVALGIYNQRRCRNLIFEILKTKSHCWWD